MAHNILLTSLSAADISLPVHYYSIRNKSGFDYCDALLDAEANIKAMLSRYEIDEIIIIGNAGSYEEEDDLNLVPLGHGNTVHSADKTSLSTYALLQHRLAQYADKLPLDQMEEDDPQIVMVREKLIRFIHEFQQQSPELNTNKYNRLFDMLSRKSLLSEKFWDALFEAIPELCDDPDLFIQWVKRYLYAELEPSAKMKFLPTNDGVRIRLIPEAQIEDAEQWVDNMMTMKDSIIEDQEDINLYISLNSDDASDTFVILNMLDILVSMPGSGVQLKKIFAIHTVPRHMTIFIKNDTKGFDLTELFHAISAFLNYGRADMIAKIWKKYNDHNEYISGMVYAMRDVDVGLSMCNTPVVERGILRLRKLFESEEFWRAASHYGMDFSIIAESIREDYGSLLEGDGQIPFIDLVKWAYRHQFYQQTLTLIESKAPEDLVRYGIFYYCGDEKNKDQVTQLFVEKRLELKPQEYFKIDNIDHYFIKTYNRSETRGKGKKGEDPRHVYAVMRAQSIQNTDPTRITGLTVCDSMETLQELLYAYYNIGNVRNKIAHAEGTAMTDKYPAASESDEIPSLVWMKDAINLFIDSFEKALAEVKDKNPNVIIITGDSVRKAADHKKYKNSPKNPDR